VCGVRFKSDSQRRAVFAKLHGNFGNSLQTVGCNKFSFPSESVLSTAPKYVFDEKPVDQFSMKSDYEGIIRGLKNVETNPKYAVELREKARIEREKAENILAEKFKGDKDIEIPVTKYEESVTQEDIDSYMRKYNLKSVPDVGLVAEDKAADADRFKGVIHYETAPDSYADYQKYLLDETKKLEDRKKRGIGLGSYIPEEKPGFSKKSDSEKEDLSKEKIGEKLQKEFADRLPGYMATSVDWYGLADPKMSLADNRKKAHKDLGAFLENDYSSAPRKSRIRSKTELWEAKMEDASKGRDPDALRSEESLKAEIEDEYGDGYYANHARGDE